MQYILDLFGTTFEGKDITTQASKLRRSLTVGSQTSNKRTIDTSHQDHSTMQKNTANGVVSTHQCRTLTTQKSSTMKTQK